MYEINNLNQIEDKSKYEVKFQYESDYIDSKMSGYDLKCLLIKIIDQKYVIISNMLINLNVLYAIEWNISDEDDK